MAPTWELLAAAAELAAPLFLLMDPVGNAPTAMALLRDLPPPRQQRVLARELLFALGIAVLFVLLGEHLLGYLGLQPSSLRIAGGIILFLVSLKMVFPAPSGGSRHTISGEAEDDVDRDPFIVPIAMPLIAGPALLAAVMLYASQYETLWPVLGGLVMAWLGAAAILLSAPFLARKLGRRGMRAAERLMGLILILLAVQMLEDGVAMFLRQLGVV